MAFPYFCRSVDTAVRSTVSLVAILISAALGNSLHAQLRTGSSSRSLYADPPVKEVKSSIKFNDTVDSSKPTQRSSRKQPARKPELKNDVQLASCAAGEAGSIVEGQIIANDVSSGGEYEFESDGFDTGGMSTHSRSGCCDSGQCQPSGYFSGVSPLQSLLSRLSVRAEVPLFWRKGHATPALVTTAPNGTSSDVAGQLGQNSTEILQGGVFGQDMKAGMRITVGTYFDPCQNYGVLFRYWNAGTRNDRSQFDSEDFPILARPFLNTSGTGTPANDTQLVAFPGDSVGSIQVAGRSELYGLDLSLRRMWYADRFTRIDWLYGYQHTLIGERLTIDSETTVIGNVPPIQGSSIAVSDRFQTENSFHGSTLGFLWNRRVACLQFENMIRLGFGNLRREVQIAGSTQTTSEGTSNTVNEGLLARGTNSRSVIDNTFVIAPEVGINLAWALNPYMDFTIGYNYLMLPKVLQAGQLIDPDLRVNLSDPLTGALDPAFEIREGRYWVRTLGLGLQVRY